MKPQATSHKPHLTTFNDFLLLAIVIFFSSTYVNSQNTQDYFLKIKQGHDLGVIQKTTNIDSTLTLTMDNSRFAALINQKLIYRFEKPFSNLNSAFLDLVYFITIDDSVSINDILNSVEVDYLELIEDDIQKADEPMPYAIIPNDYIDALFGGRNTSLDLIKAPLAWTISTGENVLVGVADTKVDINHYDIPMFQEINQPITNTDHHGTGVVGMIAAKTNNGAGIASLAHNVSIVSAPRMGFQAVNDLAQIPGVKIINCSWQSHCNYSQTRDELYSAIADRGILVVVSAGNGPGFNPCGDGHGYAYPASYDSTLSVTSVGDRVPIGVMDDGIPGHIMSWIDVHRHRPDVPGNTSSHTHNNKVDVCAPGINVLILTDNYIDYPNGFRRGIGTSITAPIVSALGALIFSVNPNLTAYQVKDIIKNTSDDIYYIPYNQPYVGQLGTGRINAYRAVKTAQCMLNPGGGLDLAMQNSNEDSFVEPDTETEILWQSKDIWVRNQNDGNIIKVHENPEYSGSTPSYVYVRVTNNSCVITTGNETLNLYWSKANTALTWPSHWDGSLYIEDPVTNEDILMGDEIGSLNIPVLGPGESKILEFPWNVPNPDDYKNINLIPWNFSFLARIESLDDPISPIVSTSLPHLVRNNNNVVWKNTSVVDLIPNLTASIGGAVGIGNPFDTPRAFNLEFKIEDTETGKPIYVEAEVSLEMDDILFNAWQSGGHSSTHADSTNISNKKIITDNNAKLNNIQFGANEIGTLNVKFNFLTKEVTNKKKYTLYVIQRDAVTNELIGGETYIVNKIPRPVFNANAGNDETIDRSESITISAAQINESAVYNWYDPDGNLIYTGTDLTVSPSVTKKYKLEIISDLDGYKDYDEVKVTVNPYYLQSLSPNPTSNQVTINYEAKDAGSAYLMVTSTSNGTSNNYIIDTIQNSITIDVSTYTNGTYNIALVCDGQIQDSKNLLKQ